MVKKYIDSQLCGNHKQTNKQKTVLETCTEQTLVKYLYEHKGS